MAIQNLNSEFQALAQVLSDKVMRTAATQQSNDMKFDYTRMIRGLMTHYFGSESGGTAGPVIGRTKGSKEIVKKYVSEAIDALYKFYANDQARRFIIESYTKGKFLHVFCLGQNQFYIGTQIQGVANPYDTLRDTSGDIYNEIVEGNPEYRRLFWGDASAFLSKEKGDGGLKKSAYGMGNALNAGHVIGVSENLAHATYDVTKGLEQNINDINIPETDPAFKDFQRLKETFSIHNEHLGKIVLKVKHNRPKFDEGKIASGTVLFETDFLSLVAEGAKSNIGKKWESEAGNAVRRLKNKVLKELEKFMEAHPIWAREGSKSIRDKVHDTFATPKLRKRAKNKAKTKYKKPGGKVSKPLKPIIVETATLKSKSSVGSPMADTKGKGKRAVARGAQQGPNLTSLQALINAKLPQTVAKNMGPPALENRTGRFASSVHITDVSRTAQGYPSIGYNYQRNPYQVFEMSHGDPRWATPDRDPRKLIDSSIREIAAQLAIGRFYTRRI